MSSEIQNAIRYIPMIVEALRAMNGVGKAAAVKDCIAQTMEANNQTIPDTILSGGASKFANDIQWARMYLVNASLLEPRSISGHGIWKLTSAGWDVSLSPDSVKSIYELTTKKSKSSTFSQENPSDEDVQPELEGLESWESGLKKILTTMPDKGFERLCALIMTKNGLLSTTVTGQTGDGGVDGEGMLALDDLNLVTVPVAWQCKRYKDSPISPNTVRDFRGAIDGRAKYGLIFTSSVFTPNAEIEARRPGTTPIELVGLDRLIDLMGKHKIGVSEQEDGSREVAQDFFFEYLHPAGKDTSQFGLKGVNA